jgi:hypothetical protein
VDQPGELTHKIHELLMAEEKIKETAKPITARTSEASMATSAA